MRLRPPSSPSPQTLQAAAWPSRRPSRATKRPPRAGCNCRPCNATAAAAAAATQRAALVRARAAAWLVGPPARPTTVLGPPFAPDCRAGLLLVLGLPACLPGPTCVTYLGSCGHPTCSPRPPSHSARPTPPPARAPARRNPQGSRGGAPAHAVAAHRRPDVPPAALLQVGADRGGGGGRAWAWGGQLATRAP